MICSEKEQLVFEYGPAETAAVLVALERVLLRREEVAGIQVPIADEFEGAAMVLVGAGLRDDIDHGAGAEPVLCREVVGLDREFLNGIRVRKGKIRVQVRVVVTSAVHLEINGARSAAADIGVLLTGIDAALAVDEAILSGFIQRSSREE